MRRRQCKVCGRWSGRLTGKVVKRKIEDSAQLPGLEGYFKIRRYTVQCTECGKKWTYRKKAK